MAVGLARWSRIRLEPDPEELVRRTLARREANFLELMRRAVFANPNNPYYTLFHWAGCSYGDLEKLVLGEGMEAALEKLLQAGVYLEHDEFKGKKPVRRNGREFFVHPAGLVNVAYPGGIEASSSGSRGRPTINRGNLAYQVYREAQNRVLMTDYESDRRTHVAMSSILPSVGGLRRSINAALRGKPIDRWFAIGSQRRGARHYEWMTRALLMELRLLGLPVVFPEFLPHNDFRPVARWIEERKRQGAACLVTGGVSRGLRVVAAAAEAGIDIAGTLFLLGGEALTEAKRAFIEAAGCEAHARYTISELGPVGCSCRQMQGNCVHVCLDSVAVIQRRRPAPLSGQMVDSLLFTSLLPFASIPLVNVEMDDAGQLGPARCDCTLRRMGFSMQIDRIFSYGKLTGQGATLLSGDLLRILEQRLPARFGGAPTDYQLVEREGQAQTEIELRVHPRLRIRSEEEVKRFFLKEVKGLWGGALTGNLWVHSEGLRVVFAEPYVTGRGKIHALHLLGAWNTDPRRRS